jgi:hypothetical protein
MTGRVLCIIDTAVTWVHRTTPKVISWTAHQDKIIDKTIKKLQEGRCFSKTMLFTFEMWSSGRDGSESTHRFTQKNDKTGFCLLL